MSEQEKDRVPGPEEFEAMQAKLSSMLEQLQRVLKQTDELLQRINRKRNQNGDPKDPSEKEP
jgi:hypothetical protein